MFRRHGDMEASVPAVSSSSADKRVKRDGSRSKRAATKAKTVAKLKKGTSNVTSSKLATTGGGSDRKQSPPDPKPNNTKKLLLVFGILLCVVSIVAIILVVSGVFGSSYNKSMEQFSGDLQIEELDEELVIWSDDYSDMQSSKSQHLINSVSKKVTTAFEEEEIFVDKVTISKLSPTDPTTFTTSHPVAKSSRSGTGWVSRSNLEWENLTPEQLKEIEIETVEHKDVRFVSTKFVTTGVPSKNAAVFSASNGRWPEVSEIVQARVASQGMKITMSNLQPNTPFMNSVHQAVQAKPEITNSPARVPSASPSKCDCRLNGFRVRTRVKLCQCESSCTYLGIVIWGGYQNEFAVQSPICASAFYAGLIQPQGGLVEVLMTGKGQAAAGLRKNGFNPLALPFQTRMYKLKSDGPVIQPPTASPIFSNNQHNTNYGETTDASMFTMHVHYQAIQGQPVNYDPSYDNVQGSQSQNLIASISPQVQAAVQSQGFTVGLVDVVQILMPPEKIGIIFELDIKGKDHPNVKNAVGLESKDPAKVPLLISPRLEQLGGVIRSFRYARGFLEKMTDLMDNRKEV